MCVHAHAGAGELVVTCSSFLHKFSRASRYHFQQDVTIVSSPVELPELLFIVGFSSYSFGPTEGA